MRVSRRIVSSGDMVRIRVTDLEKLREVLEDVELMQPVYRRLLNGRIVRAELKLDDHSGGARVEGYSTRKWVYVELYSDKGMVYEAALWKILKFAEAHSAIYEKLTRYVQIE